MSTRRQTMSRSLSYRIISTISAVVVSFLLAAAPPERGNAKPASRAVNAPLMQPSAMKAEYLATLSIAASGAPRIGPYSALSALCTGASFDSPMWTLRGEFSTRPGRIKIGASFLFLTGFGPAATTPLMELVVLQAGEFRDCWNLIDTDEVRPFPEYFLEPGFILDRRGNFKGVPEYEAFWQTLVLAHYTSTKAFAKAARRDVTYFNLFNEPELYRGQVVHLSGRLIRLVGYVAPDEARAAGVGDLYEGWIMTDANGANPLCVAFTDLPPGLTVDNERKYNIPVGVDGYFYKRYRYKAVDSKKPNEFRDAPLLIGHSLTGKFGAAETDESDNWGHSLIWAFLTVVGGALVGVLALTAWFRYHDRRVRQRLRASRDLAFVPPSEGPSADVERGTNWNEYPPMPN